MEVIVIAAAAAVAAATVLIPVDRERILLNDVEAEDLDRIRRRHLLLRLPEAATPNDFVREREIGSRSEMVVLARRRHRPRKSSPETIMRSMPNVTS